MVSELKSLPCVKKTLSHPSQRTTGAKLSLPSMQESPSFTSLCIASQLPSPTFLMKMSGWLFFLSGDSIKGELGASSLTPSLDSSHFLGREVEWNDTALALFP